jgi:ribokinase
MLYKKTIKIITVGGSTQDIFFSTDAGVLINNSHDLLRQKLIGFEYGAKINIPQADFCFGGGASNSAVCLSRLGAKITSLICVGNDKTGESILENLKHSKVDVSYVQFSKKSSGYSCAIVYGRKTHDHILFTFRGANEDLKINARQLEKIRPDWIYLSSLSGKKWTGVLNNIFSQKIKNNLQIAWNPGNLQIKSGLENLKNYLKNCDVFILNKDEALELLAKKISNQRIMLAELHKYCPHKIILTDGQRGAYAIDKSKKIFFQPVNKIEKHDTTGVGDAFGATFVWGLEFFHQDMQAALEVATINAAAVIRKLGAQAGLLIKSQLLREL